MRIAHLADLHLGFRQFNRTTPRGLNQREADVYAAFTRVVDGVLAAQVDLVLIAGDVFHSMRPPNAAILAAFVQLQRLRTAGLPVVIVAGNHDAPRTAEADSILGLYRALGCEIVQGNEPKCLELAGGTIVAVPSGAVRSGRTYFPDPAPSGRTLCVAHVGTPVPKELLDPRWAYVALGDEHITRRMGQRAWYAGSTEYTSSDPWAESREHPGKGWLLVDVPPEGEPAVQFQPITTRRFVDLPTIEAKGMSAADVNAAVAAAVAGAPAFDDAVVRLVVEGVSKATNMALDYAAIRAFKARALHFQLELRRLEAAASAPEARRVRMQSLDRILDNFLGERDLPADVDRAALQALGRQYFDQASDAP